MPNCFSLIRKSKPEEGPVRLAAIDREMCDYFGAACSDRFYYYDWHDIIGFRLAIGRTFAEIRVSLYEELARLVDGEEELARSWERLIEICDWLDQNFTASSWATRFKV